MKDINDDAVNRFAHLFLVCPTGDPRGSSSLAHSHAGTRPSGGGDRLCRNPGQRDGGAVVVMEWSEL
ncbi:hypothetical protein U9M48_040960 [Paspalum notatum var. saurae]|uniref:Uncharacterized protein n=1 Tax=Paspalum notatum var. saurae TaxID=547442 RepID=A0AAQ3UMY8_PASNO